MRLLDLNLSPFGIYDDKKLSFPTDKGIVVIYGPNEAGKSTCLRAISGLLFGIPMHTTDAFRHEGSKLSIGAKLMRSDGEVLEVFRRKGRKGTLLNNAFKPIDDKLLDSYLGGIDQERFLLMYSMNRDDLVKGGQTLVAEKGAMGEALFSTGMGSVDLKSLLEKLETEADGLYKPQGSNPLINAVARNFKELTKTVRDAELRVADWKELDAKVAELDRNFEEFRNAMDSLESRKERLTRLRNGIPLIRERQMCRAQMDELGEVRILREEFRIDRATTEQTIRDESAKLEVAREKGKKEEDALKMVEVPGDLLAQEEVIKSLNVSLGARLQELEDLPTVEGMVSEARRTAESILNGLKPGIP